MAAATIRILIAESDENLRRALAVFFSVQEGFEVVGEVANSAEVRLLCQQLQPDVLFLDLELQPSDFVSFIGSLFQEYPTIRIVALEPKREDNVRQQDVLQAGASKYLTRGNFASDIAAAVRQLDHHKG
ncbi:MAG: response regulator transcription factor [Chloroflexi bacterium]|nr:response regulator transcription factor [Chloroflexota bacterium]